MLCINLFMTSAHRGSFVTVTWHLLSWLGTCRLWMEMLLWAPGFAVVGSDSGHWPPFLLPGKVYDACIWSCMLHGSETWWRENTAVHWEEIRMIRWMCGVKLRDQLSRIELRQWLERQHIVRYKEIYCNGMDMFYERTMTIEWKMCYFVGREPD